jgi:hypothetical protein
MSRLGFIEDLIFAFVCSFFMEEFCFEVSMKRNQYQLVITMMKMSLFQTISTQKTLLLTSIAAYKVILLPSCISKLGSKVSHPNVVCGCICASITSACTAIYIWHKRKGSISKWKLLLSFGARLAGVRFVERYIDDPNDATNALRILQTMVKTDKHMHKFVVELGGIETTVKAMKRYSQEHDGVAASGSGLVSSMCGYDASPQTANLWIVELFVPLCKPWNTGQTTKRYKLMRPKHLIAWHQINPEISEKRLLTWEG